MPPVKDNFCHFSILAEAALSRKVPISVVSPLEWHFPLHVDEEEMLNFTQPRSLTHV